MQLEQRHGVVWKVVLYFSNLASICSPALILLSPSRWFVMSGWLTSISLQHVFKHVRILVPCLRTRISFQHCVSNPFGLWFRVWVQALSSWFLGQTRLDFGSLFCTSISLHPCLKHIWIKDPCVHASVLDPFLCTRIRSSLVQTRLILVACLFTLPPAPARGTNYFDFVCVPVDLKHQTNRNFVLVYFHNSDQCNSDMQGRACQEDSVVIYNWISGRTTGITTGGHVVVVDMS